MKFTNNFLKNNIHTNFKKEGVLYYKNNSEYIINNLKTTNDEIKPIHLTNVEKGKFYFIYYNLNGKISKMEKFNPLFIIDWLDKDNTRYVFGVSLNFLPIVIRTIFFNNICNHNLDILEYNNNVVLNKEHAFKNINFANIYTLLKSIGFEWTIRKFDIKLINKVNIVSSNILEKFITMSTFKLTGVDDAKLIDIWKTKIQQQNIREQKLYNELIGDLKSIQTELINTQNSLNNKNSNLEQAYKIMNSI